MIEAETLPKSISNTDTVNILARIEKLRLMHVSLVAKRFSLSLTDVKIMGFVRSNNLKRGASDILEYFNIGETSVSRSIARLEKKAYLHRRSHPFNQKYLDLILAGEGNFIASYILLEQKKYLNELFDGFTHDERVILGKLLWKIDRNIKRQIMEYKSKQAKLRKDREGNKMVVKSL